MTDSDDTSDTMTDSDDTMNHSDDTADKMTDLMVVLQLI
jgi:hypothetical protein